MLATLEPELLRSFLAIAETGSFTAAAARIHRTQSAVSMQIRRLEEQLGRSLFCRDARVVTLTRDGELLMGHARRILRAHQEAMAAFDPDALEGGVVVGSPEDYATSFLPRILARFAETHPKVHVEVVCQPSRELLVGIAAGRIQLALVTQGSGEDGGTLLHCEPLVWVTSALHRVHEQDPIPMAVFEPGCSFRRHATEAMAAIGRRSRIAYTSLSLSGLYVAVEAGLAVTALARSNVRPGTRVLGEADGFPRLPEIGITLQRAQGASSPVLDRLEEHIITAFANRPGLALAA